MYALVDCTSFFASCEQIFRPDLRGKPVVVLSNNDGCIVARSPAAKALGIPDLVPYFKQKDLLAQLGVTVFSSNYELYGDISQRIMQTLEQFSPQVEIYSIDEAFLNLNNMSVPLVAYGHRIRNAVWKDIRMPVGIGIAPTKTLAKLASFISKRSTRCSGVCVIENIRDWQPLFARIPVTEVWGIGRRFGKRLADDGVHSVSDLMQQEATSLRKHYNVNMARTIAELQGQSCYTFADSQPPPKKQIYSTRSFGEKIRSQIALEQAVSQYASRAAEKLRKQNGLAKTLQVFIATSRFVTPSYSCSESVTLPYPTNDSRELIHAARQAVKHIFKSGYAYARAGVGIIEILPDRPQQLDCFLPTQSPKSQKLMQVMDQVNRQHGNLIFAAQGIQPHWKMQRNLKSPAYTTRWRDLPRVLV